MSPPSPPPPASCWPAACPSMLGLPGAPHSSCVWALSQRTAWVRPCCTARLGGGGYSFCGWGGGREGADGSCVSPYAIPMGPVGQLRTAQLVAPGRCCHPTLGDAASCAGTAWLCLLLTPLSSALPSGRAALPCPPPPPPPKIRAGCCTPPIPTLGSHRCGVGGGFNSALLLWHLGKCIAYQCAPPPHKHTHTVWHCCDSAVGGGGGAESA